MFNVFSTLMTWSEESSSSSDIIHLSSLFAGDRSLILSTVSICSDISDEELIKGSNAIFAAFDLIDGTSMTISRSVIFDSGSFSLVLISILEHFG
jgi:hypothetical protein